MFAGVSITDRDWLPLPRLARISATSEDADHPVLAAFGASNERGWKADGVGPQVIRIRFREPLPVARIRLVFDEDQAERTQEFTLSCVFPQGREREIVRQQFTFSPAGARRQVEEFVVDGDAVTEVILRIVPDISERRVFATLRECRIAVRGGARASLPAHAADETSTDAADRILRAYRELPGLSLTRRQACVLFDLDPAQCEAVIGDVTARGALQENERGQLIWAKG